tara:strand:- start:239 stop:463 length:225 start_codon:yes stop_codon:yes gene_type:complete
MLNPLRRIIYIVLFNSSLLLILMVGIQNSSSKRKVNLIIGETVQLPVSFIIGLSFITGSISANLFSNNFLRKGD